MRGGGGQKFAKSCLRSLWMHPNMKNFFFSEFLEIFAKNQACLKAILK